MNKIMSALFDLVLDINCAATNHTQIVVGCSVGFADWADSRSYSHGHNFIRHICISHVKGR